MLPIKKLTIGIRPSVKMFRVRSTWGEVADAVLGVLNHKFLGEKYFSNVGTNEAGNSLAMRNPDSGTLLRVDQDNILFSRHTYGSGAKLNVHKALEEFEILWSAVNSQLHVRDVRRIGIVGEARLYDISEPSKRLAELISKIPVANFPAKFHQSFEERLPTKGGRLPDVAKSDFINIIRNYYESSMDVDDPEDDCINANFDFQHYYSPLVTKNIFGEVKIHFRAFEEQWKIFHGELKEMGLTE